MNNTAELAAYELRRTHTQPTPVDRTRLEVGRAGRVERRRRLALRLRAAADRLDS